jgi:3D (Asp-Asp-Asp) domain-containing protein
MMNMNRVSLAVLTSIMMLVFAFDVHALAPAHLEVMIPNVPFPEATWWDTIWSSLGLRSTIRIRPKEGTVLRVISSAYASSPNQTDATPCITAAGTTVRPGVVATNFLPLGTIISIDGEKYIVEDRMNSRYNGYYLDIWFPSTREALDFGRKKLDITILAYDEPGAELSPSPLPQQEKKWFWQLFTRIYNNPNTYDVDCTI